MKYLGLDAHAKHCTLAAVNEKGHVLFDLSFETSEKNLIEAVKRVPGKKTLAIEESTLAGWVARALGPYVDALIVCDPKENKWIAGGKDKKDKIDAQKLAKLLRGGYLKSVHHPEGNRQAFKEVVLLYHQISKEVRRSKNRLKAKFRQHGVFARGQSIYDPSQRRRWVEQLSFPEADWQAEQLFRCVDYWVKQRAMVKRKIRGLSKPFPEVAAFHAIPGVGLIVASTFSAIIDTPFRFANKRKVWSYAKLALDRRSSDEAVEPEHLSREGVPLLKHIAKTAMEASLRAKDSEFARQYKALIRKGISPSMARLTVARSILATMYGMWKTGEPYRPRR